MHDGAVKGAGVEGRREKDEGVVVTALEALGHGGRLVAAVVGLCAWMLLMTAIYFHTWFEKVSPCSLGGLFWTSERLTVNSLLAFWWPWPDST